MSGCARRRQADMLAKASAEFGECRETALDWDAFTAALDRRHMVLAPWCGLLHGDRSCRVWNQGVSLSMQARRVIFCFGKCANSYFLIPHYMRV